MTAGLMVDAGDACPTCGVQLATSILVFASDHVICMRCGRVYTPGEPAPKPPAIHERDRVALDRFWELWLEYRAISPLRPLRLAELHGEMLEVIARLRGEPPTTRGVANA